MLLRWLIASTFICVVLGQDGGSSSSVHCHALSRDNYTCAHCIQLHPTCAWCTKQDFENRCDTYDRLKASGCSDADIENPKSKAPKSIRNEDYSVAGIADETKAVQLRPQEINIEIRPKEKVEFIVRFKQTMDYPVDLYYLMDLSHSMLDDKEKLTKLGDKLANRMKSITRNFRLGFGSFVDKAVMPWVDSRPDKAKKPCDVCVEPYGYKHHMTLTKETEEFKQKVNESRVSGNLDAPEGGFDAIMQALVCEKEIGWRKSSRKMLVYSSDAGFHYAGDGRLAGIVIPNDGGCHLENSEYTKSIEQDYPSISQLHQKIKEKQANVIFAVTGEQVRLYERLHAALPDVSTTVGRLAEDSSNIVELIADEYNKISQKIAMQDNSSGADGLKLTYFTSCQPTVGDKDPENNTCAGVKVNDEVAFRVVLEATHCGEKHDFVITIGPAGLSDILKLNVHIICGCGCEKPGAPNFELKSEKCSRNGNYECGVCRCVPRFIGRKCECDTQGSSAQLTTVAMERLCRKSNTTDSRAPLCEGRGYCECGECKCYPRDNPDEKVTGRHCECDNFNCPRHNKQLCNGHGTCTCQECVCDAGWEGDACECPKSQVSCIASNQKICNGRGTCHCGVCRCERDGQGVRYSGPTCEICPTCPDKCEEYRPCVMCQQFKTGPYNVSGCELCPFKVIPVKELPATNVNNNNKTLIACQFVDPADDCTFKFAYDLDEALGNMTVYVKEEKQCPALVPVLAIVLGVIAAIVLIGLLLLLIWKVLTVLHDRREYAKFEQERMNSRFPAGENPLFHPATSTYQNPLYNGKKHT